MKKIFIALMCMCVAMMCTACSTETSFTTETKVSASVNSLQDLLDKGNQNLNANKPDDAIKNYTAAIEIDADSAEAYNGRGIAYAQKHDFAATIKEFGQAIKFAQNPAEAYSNRGQAYADSGDAQKALADFNKSIELDAKNDTAYVNRGVLHYNAGDIDKAVADFRKALELNPNNTDAKKVLEHAAAN